MVISTVRQLTVGKGGMGGGRGEASYLITPIFHQTFDDIRLKQIYMYSYKNS